MRVVLLSFAMGMSVALLGVWVYRKYFSSRNQLSAFHTIDVDKRFAVLGELTSGLLHDMVNPLATILLSLDSIENTLKNKLPEEEAPIGSLQRSRRAASALQRLIAVVQKQIKPQKAFQIFPIRPLLEEASFMAEFRGMDSGLTVEIECSLSCSLRGNPVSFSRLSANLLSNALDAYGILALAREGDPKKIRVVVEEKEEVIYISVQDWASGVKDSFYESAFSPFETSKSIDKGSGIGLSLCKKIVEAEYQGIITMESKKGKGTTVVVTIPRKKQSEHGIEYNF